MEEVQNIQYTTENLLRHEEINRFSQPVQNFYFKMIRGQNI